MKQLENNYMITSDQLLNSVTNSNVFYELLREETKKAGEIIDVFIEVVGLSEAQKLSMGMVKAWTQDYQRFANEVHCKMLLDHQEEDSQWMNL